MQKANKITLKKLVLALAIAGYAMGSAQAVLTASTGTIKGTAPILNSATQAHAVDLESSNQQGTRLASGDIITLTYRYDDAEGDADISASDTNVEWYYVKSGIETRITTGIVNSPATSSGGNGTSKMTIPSSAIGAEKIKVVIKELAATGDPVLGQTITIGDTHENDGGTITPPGPIVPGGNVTAGIYLSTDTSFSNNLIGAPGNLDVGKTYVFKLWDSNGVGTTDLTGSVTYDWRLVGTSATDNVTAPADGFVTGVTDANYTVPVNSVAMPITGSADGAQGFGLAVDYN